MKHPKLFNWSFFYPEPKTMWKKFATLAARAVFVSLFQKLPIFDFLAGNNYPDSPLSQGVWNLPHKFHIYLIYIARGVGMSGYKPFYGLQKQVFTRVRNFFHIKNVHKKCSEKIWAFCISVRMTRIIDSAQSNLFSVNKPSKCWTFLELDLGYWVLFFHFWQVFCNFL